MKKEKLISIGIGVLIFVIVIIIAVAVKNKSLFVNNTKEIYGAIGGGKENLLADEKINDIFAKKYGIKLVQDSWSNGKTVKVDVVRENGSKYDLIFFSDQRYYDEYKTPADPTLGEAQRYTVLDGQLTLNTPIVIYSWEPVVQALIKEKIVTVSDGVYYITDMEKLMNYILEGKKWTDIGVDIFGSINIGSVDPVTSSPGATYYGLLLSIMAGGDINDESIRKALPKLKEFYQKSGYMNSTPADLFSMFLKTGMGTKPMIVDYEKSVIDFANSNPTGWEQVKDKVIILYPTPTIWNSHCIAALTEDGKTLIKAFEDEEVGQLSWSKHGFRVGVTGGNYDVSKTGIKGIPSEIKQVTSGLKMEYYDRVINCLSGKGECN
jgi:hypothetical protein